MHGIQNTIMNNFERKANLFYQFLVRGDLVSIGIVSWWCQQAFGTLFKP